MRGPLNGVTRACCCCAFRRMCWSQVGNLAMDYNMPGEWAPCGTSAIALTPANSSVQSSVGLILKGTLNKNKRDRTRFASKSQRRQILKRDKFCCRYCGERVAINTAHIDHVVPWSMGGPTTDENLVTSCRTCNEAKSNYVGIWPKSVRDIQDYNNATGRRDGKNGSKRYTKPPKHPAGSCRHIESCGNGACVNAMRPERKRQREEERG